MQVRTITAQVLLLISLANCKSLDYYRKTVIAEFWENRDFFGNRIELYQNERLQNLANWNNRTTSYKVYANVSLFSGTYGEGDVLELVEGSSGNLPREWNDRACSIFDSNSKSEIIADFYTNTNFAGARIRLAENEKLEWLESNWNDKISAINVIKPVRVCENTFGQGMCITLQPMQYNDLKNLDKRISSIYDASNEEIAGIFYDQQNYTGEAFQLYTYERATSMGIWNDRISSYKIFRPILVCEDVFNKGRCTLLQPSEYPQLDKEWDNCISSMNDELYYLSQLYKV